MPLNLGRVLVWLTTTSVVRRVSDDRWLALVVHVESPAVVVVEEPHVGANELGQGQGIDGEASAGLGQQELLYRAPQCL